MGTEIDQKRINMTLKVMQVLNDWALSASQQSDMLAMPDGTRSRHMHQYSEGRPFPQDDELDTRADHILGISDALRTSYPRNVEMGAFWMKRENKLFNKRTPLNCILNDGLDGLHAVRVHLDCAYGWHLDETTSTTDQK